MFYGLSKPIIAKRTVEAGVEKYSEGFQCGKAVGTSVTPNYSEASQYGDDQLADYIKEFIDANVSVNTTTMPLEAGSTIFGHTVNKEEKSIEYGANDEANEVGYGFYAREINDGVRTIVACWMPNVKFAEGAESYSTKNGSITFQTPTIEGKAGVDLIGNWKYKQTFETVEAAVAWLKGKAGITE